MKVFKRLNLSALLIVFLSVTLTTCESDDENVSQRSVLEANFISTVEARTVSFVNISNDATSFMWDFGNGTTSTLVDPVVTFDNGTFDVTLTAYDDNGNSATHQETFVIDVPICVEETTENLDPANGDINWTFLTTNGDATFDAFGGTAGFIVTNPVIDNVNESCNVQRFEKTSGCETFAGLGIGLDNPIDFSTTTNKTFTMKVLAETQLTEVTLRLEFMAFPDTEPSQDRVASITELGEWQELTFDFTDVPTGTFQSVIIYFERNATCDGDIYYFDDIVQQ